MKRAPSEVEGRTATPARPSGFVLPFVVFLLFSVSVAGVTGYMIVSSEFELSRYSGQGSEALTVARAGVDRFVSEQLGVVDDTVAYALGDGVVSVTARRVMSQDSVTDLYYVRGEATVDDPLTPGSPARRTVGAYAVHHRRPLPHLAALAVGADRVDVTSGEVHGVDYDTPVTCAGGGATSIPGAVARLAVTESAADDVQGQPQWELWPGGWSDVRAALGVRWDVLTDPNFPVDFENTTPDFGLLPADSFPVIRYTGDLGAGFSGRGVLIVDGILDMYGTFQWEGIVMAKHLDDIVQGNVDGIVVAGLDEPNLYGTIEVRGSLHYNSCSVYAANESLSYMELLRYTISEVE
jgi:hypothetical protein